jgi:hypothetical protein
VRTEFYGPYTCASCNIKHIMHASWNFFDWRDMKFAGQRQEEEMMLKI